MNRSTITRIWLCHWCHRPIDLTSVHRVDDPALQAGVGRMICTPSCDARPEGARTFRVWGRGAS